MISFPFAIYIILDNCDYAEHVFISEHIIVSLTLLSSTSTLCDQGECLAFLSMSLYIGDPRLQHLYQTSSPTQLYITRGVLVNGRLNQLFTAVTLPTTDLARPCLTSVICDKNRCLQSDIRYRINLITTVCHVVTFNFDGQ
jgi:hypothetical protein